MRLFKQNWVDVRQDCPLNVPQKRGLWDPTGRAVIGQDYLICVYEGNEQQEEEICTANPIQPASGRKLKFDTDWAGVAASLLAISRVYRSTPQPDLGWSATSAVNGWMFTYQARLVVDIPGQLRPTVRAQRPSGIVRSFYATVNADGSRTWSTYDGTGDALSELRNSSGVRTGWRLRVFADDSVESYGPAGVLRSIRYRNGKSLTFEYSTTTTPLATAPRPGLLIGVRTADGMRVRFIYAAAGHVSQTLPPGAVADRAAGSDQSPIRYRYSELASLGTSVPDLGQLTSVVRQDGSVLRYHYEDPRFPLALTGVTDENGIRAFNFTYAWSGRATRSEKAAGIERLDVSFNPNTAGIADLTDYAGPNGAARSRSMTFLNQSGVLRLATVSAPCPLCGPTKASRSLRPDGRPTRELAHDGSVDFFAYDSSGREVERASFGPAYAGSSTRPPLSQAVRVVSTRWMDGFTQPTLQAAPDSVTTVLYNGTTCNGQSIGCAPSNASISGKPLPLACWVIEQPTTDTNGSLGFNAAPSGNAAVTRATYNATGQLLLVEVYENVAPALTATPTSLPGMQQPAQRRAYVYAAASDANYSKGDLQTLTVEQPALSPASPAQVTTFRRYNKRGQVLEFQSPDGSVSTLTYHARGWLTRYDWLPAGGNLQTTRYTYDAAGQLKRATLPDGVVVNFTFDDAQRFTGIHDSQGNRETYVLDNAGNRSLQRVGSMDALMRNLARAMFPSVALPSGPTALVSAPAPVLLAAIGPAGALVELDTSAPLSMKTLADTILAQVPPPPRTLPTSPAWSPPAPPMADPSLLMDRFGREQRSLREEVERLLARCECPPDGGFDKPTLTTLSWAHLLVSGHLAPTWSNKSYFTESVSQAFLDEVMSKPRSETMQGDRIAYHVPEMGRVVGMSPSNGGNFEPRRDVTVIVQQTNCFNKYLAGWRSRNEVITMYPGK
jgi:YD repeat-containing protein